MEVIDVDMVISKISSLYEHTIESCKKMFDYDEMVDYEAEAAAMVAEQITKHHIHIHRNFVLDKDETGVIFIKPK